MYKLAYTDGFKKTFPICRTQLKKLKKQNFYSFFYSIFI